MALALLTNPIAAIPELWEKAVEIFEANQDWEAKKMIFLMELSSAEGKVEKTIESHLRLLGEKDEEGNPKTELILAYENGKDVTEKRKKENRNRRSNHSRGSDMEAASPFDPEKQAEVTITSAGSMALINSIVSQRFDFRQKLTDSKKIAVGTAWLDRITGAPIKVSYTLDPLPMFTESLSVSISYLYEDPATWYPETMEFSGVGGFLFIKKHFKTKMKFIDYSLK